VKLLLDTHALLWWLFDDPQLPRRARDAIEQMATQVFMSSASGWEIAIKSRLGKLPYAQEAVKNLAELLRVSRIEVLPIILDHALAAGALPGPLKDPFDRMLIAQAQIENLTLVSADRAFKRYRVPLLWNR
jgi:PIN domain nuclease of toxin-antitoxin system